MDEFNRRKAIKQHIERDPFAKMLGATVEAIEEGSSRVSLKIEEHHLNFHGTAHGGVVFALADIAFAAASNSRGQTAVGLNVDIAYLQATEVGDTLVAVAEEIRLNGPIGLYEITVVNRYKGGIVARNQATVYRKKEFFVAS